MNINSKIANTKKYSKKTGHEIEIKRLEKGHQNPKGVRKKDTKQKSYSL